MKIGIMGGTFNPVHMGHLLLAEAALDGAALDQVWLIPTGCSYLKQEGIPPLPARERYHMVELAIADNDRFRCLDIEVNRPGNTYTYETLELLREQYPEHEYYFICGADCLFALETWKYPERLCAACTILAAVRDDADPVEMQAQANLLTETYHAKIQLLPFRRIDLSSSEIRALISHGKSIRYLVPEAVRAYIEEKGVYRNE